MIFRFQDKKLSFQIWIILGAILVIFSALITLIVPIVLRYSFTKETYARLEDHQEFLIKYQNEFFSNREKIIPPPKEAPPPFPPPENENSNHPHPPFRVAEHMFLDKNGVIQKKIGIAENSADFIKVVRGNIKKQELKVRRYQTEVNKKIYFYVIRKVNMEGKEGYLVSYLKGEYRDNFVKDVFFKFIQIIGIVLLVSWIASIFIARYLTKPLTQLQKKVKDIAKKNWNNSVILERGDEIGQLAETIEWMREQLVEHNKKHQDFLQQVSHELKTPVMIIKSYIQSIKDGIFPKGDFENSLEIIEEATERLDKRVHFLLGYTKYEYLSNHQLEETEFDLAELIRETANIFMWRNSDINWELDIEPVMIKGDKEKLKIALENIFDNQIRYAKTTILVNLVKKRVTEEQEIKDNCSYIIKIWNDGPEIEEDIMDNIFKKYEKGYEGNFGLGLAIVKLLIELHNGSIWVNNENNGVAFYIKI